MTHIMNIEQKSTVDWLCNAYNFTAESYRMLGDSTIVTLRHTHRGKATALVLPTGAFKLKITRG